MRLHQRFLSFFNSFKKSGASIVFDIGGIKFGGVSKSNLQNEYRGWVYACVSAAAERAASYKLRLYQRKNGKEEEVISHPALALFHDPNPDQTFRELLINLFSNLLITGDAFWLLPKNLAGSKPAQIWSLNPSVTTAKVGQNPDLFNSLLRGYEHINGSGQTVLLPRENIVHFRTFNPKTIYKGMSPIEAAALSIDNHNFASEHNRNVLEKGGHINGVLSTDSKLTPEQATQLKELWNSAYGGKENSGKTAVLHSGLNYTQASLSQKDLDFVEGKKLSRDEVLGVYKTPKSVLGMTDGVSVSNADSTFTIYSQTVILPLHDLVTSFLNEWYLYRFGLDSTVYFFKFDNCVPENRDILLREHSTGISSGWLTINEVRAARNYPSVKGGDQLYIPFGATPLGSDKPADNDPDEKKIKAAKVDLSKLTEREFADYVEAWIERHVKSYLPRAKRFYLDRLEELIAKLPKEEQKAIKGYEDILDDANDWPNALIDLIMDMGVKSVVAGAKDGLEYLGSDEVFNVKSPEVIFWLKQNAVAKASTIANTLKNTVRELIVQAVDEGWGAMVLADRLREKVEGMAPWKAELIARSELVDGYNHGAHLGYIQSGVVDEKKWLTSGFDQCDTCLENEAQGAIPLNDVFKSGHMSPKAHGNCRCTEVPVPRK